jgi:hypothetical protein
MSRLQYTEIILYVVLYGFETWSLTLREECLTGEGAEEDILTQER